MTECNDMYQRARASPVSDSYNRQILYAATPKDTLQCAQLRHLNVASLASDSVLQCSNCLSFPISSYIIMLSRKIASCTTESASSTLRH